MLKVEMYLLVHSEYTAIELHMNAHAFVVRKTFVVLK